MIYVREEMLLLWKTTGYINPLNDSNIPILTSVDYKHSNGKFICPKCWKPRQHVLTRVDGKWACNECHKTKINNTKRHYRAANIHLITNDLFSYFGDKVSSDKLFDPLVVESFIDFAGYKQRPAVCLLFMSLLNAVLARETQSLKILPYLQNMDKTLSKSLESKIVTKGELNEQVK